MSATTKLREQRAPTGLVCFGPLPETRDCFLVWLGSGGRLYLGVNPFSSSGSLTPIHHPTANGVYETLAETRAAAAAFVAAYAKEDA